MQAASPRPPLAAALAEYGRLVRTNFLLAYLADAPLRRRIGAQLNKGETMHALRRHVAFGQRQQLPADEDDHRRHALCLEVVTNAILAWNARYLTVALDDVRDQQRELIRDDALAQLSPVGHAHINPNGRYRFDVDAVPAVQLRPLRQRTAADERAPSPSQPILVNGDKHKATRHAKLLARPLVPAALAAAHAGQSRANRWVPSFVHVTMHDRRAGDVCEM